MKNVKKIAVRWHEQDRDIRVGDLIWVYFAGEIAYREIVTLLTSEYDMDFIIVVLGFHSDGEPFIDEYFDIDSLEYLYPTRDMAIAGAVDYEKNEITKSTKRIAKLTKPFPSKCEF